MTHRKVVVTVDRTLRDIYQNDQMTGGVTMLFCGDFKQTLPVTISNVCLKSRGTPRGTNSDEI